MSAFDEIFTAHATPALVNQMAELLTFTPKGGASREGLGLVDEAGTRQAERPGELDLATDLWVTFARNAAAAVTVAAGELLAVTDAEAVLGCLVRRSDLFPDGEPFVFTGETRDAAPGLWSLLFTRTGAYRHGTEHTKQRAG